MRVSYEYAEMEHDVYYYRSNYTEHFDVAILPIVANFNWNIPLNNQFAPYLGAGLGYYIPLQDIDYADAAFGGNIHGWLKFRISNSVELFGEAKYRFVEIDGYEDSVDFGGFGIIAGILFGNQMM